MYTQSITRTHRTAFILLIDGSGSMSEEILFRGRRTTKAEAVASITNALLFELIERARRNDGVRDYYDIAVLTYSGNDEVKSLLPGRGALLSVTTLREADGWVQARCSRPLGGGDRPGFGFYYSTPAPEGQVQNQHSHFWGKAGRKKAR